MTLAGCCCLGVACGGDASDPSAAEPPLAGDPAPSAAESSEGGAAESSADTPSLGPEGALPQPPAELPATPVCGSSGEDRSIFEVRTPADVERLAGCTVIQGDLFIVDLALDLTPLSSLRAIDGVLRLGPAVDLLEGPPEPQPLGSLRGLEALERVGGLSLVDVLLGSPALPLPALRGDVEALVLSNLPGVADLSAFAGIRITRDLSVESMPDLTSLAGARVGPDLDLLSVWYSPRLERLAGVAGLEHVAHLWLDETPALTLLALPAEMTQLRRATLTGPNRLTTLAELSRYSMLEELHVTDAPSLIDLGGGDAPSGSLQVLQVTACPSLMRIDPVGGLSNLSIAQIQDCDGVSELDGLAASPALQYLLVSDNDALTRLPVFARAGESMQSIQIRSNTALEQAPEFPNLVTLHDFESVIYQNAELTIADNPQLRSIGSFPRLASSSMIAITDNPLLEAVSLPSLQTLTWLRVVNNAGLQSLELDLRDGLRFAELDDNPLLGDVALGTPSGPLQLLTLRGSPALAPGVREQLLGLVAADATLNLD